MSIKKNPFTSNTFVTKWHEHFDNNNPKITLNFIDNLTFYKAKKLSVFINSGKNLTKGISYFTNNNVNHNNSIAIIYDVPEYFGDGNTQLPDNLKLHKIKQYPGYLAELNMFHSFDDYFKQRFSKKSRAKLNRYQKRLELCFDISYKMYVGAISKTEYELIFTFFKEILEKRFSAKQTTNNNLQKDEWNFYYDVTYDMILENKAGLFVVYQNKIPIGITLNYLSENILFHGITSFDIDYSKFHLGKIMLKNLFNWCFENGIKTFDFSKGHFDYKTDWMTKKYNFEYHLFINQASITSKVTGLAFILFFRLKQFLREKEINKKLHLLTYKIRNSKNNPNKKLKYNFIKVEENIAETSLDRIDFSLDEYQYLKHIINEFLFLNSEKLKNFDIYHLINKESEYLFKGLNNQKIVQINLKY